MSNTDTDRSGAERAADEAEEMDLDNLTTDELLALSRAAEAKQNVLRGKARIDDSYKDALSKADEQHQRVTEKLKEHNLSPTGDVLDPTQTVPDKEGTAPTLADGYGNYAEDAEVANIGGIGIDDSNTNPDEALAKLAEAREPMDVRGTSPNMRRDTSAAARRENAGRRGGKTRRTPLKDEGDGELEE